MLYDNIPDNKRISYGRVHTLRVLVKEIILRLEKEKINALSFGENIYKDCEFYMVKGVGLGIIANYGLKDFYSATSYIIDAAESEHWDMREFAQMFFRQLIKKDKNMAQEFLLKQAKSSDPNKRRFVGETLRPVQENRWMYKDPDYSLSILTYLFKEKNAYPRTSVGNNLSDLSKKNPDLILKICKQLVELEDKNAYWIAYRACRNLVKEYPLQVMDILNIDEYKYKTRKYKRIDYK